MLTATEVPTVAPPASVVYRLGHGPDPFLPVPWRVLRRRDANLKDEHDDQTHGGRFDDPAGRAGIAEARRFRTIYCASERIAALAESVMPFRGAIVETAVEPEKERAAVLQEIIGRHPELQVAAGGIPGDWLTRRQLGATQLDPRLVFVDLGHQETLRYLRRQLGGFAATLGIGRIDYGTLLGANRSFTQAVAGHFYEQLDPTSDRPLFAGIRYLSSLGLEWECWALFDQRFRPEPVYVEDIEASDADLIAAADHLDLAIGTP